MKLLRIKDIKHNGYVSYTVGNPWCSLWTEHLSKETATIYEHYHFENIKTFVPSITRGTFHVSREFSSALRDLFERQYKWKI